MPSRMHSTPGPCCQSCWLAITHMPLPRPKARVIAAAIAALTRRRSRRNSSAAHAAAMVAAASFSASLLAANSQAGESCPRARSQA